VTRRAAVIGGGVAGITAALDLAERGMSVTLAEVRPRLGGAAYSFERDGLLLDNGQHVFLRCCTAYRGLLERIGGTHGVELQRRLDIPVLAPGHRPARITRNGLPAPLHLAASLLRYPHLSVRERLEIGRAALALGRVDPTRDDETLGAWLEDHGQSARAIANLWDLIALPTLNVRAADAALGLGAFVFQEGLLRNASAGDVGIHQLPLSRVIGDPAREALAAAGVDVRLRWRARGVERVSGAFEVRGERESIAADAVVLAVPHGRAAALAPKELRDGLEALDGLGSSPIVNVHVVYDREVLDEPFAAGVDTPVQYIFDRTPAGWSGSRQYVAVSLSGADRESAMPVDQMRALYVPALEELLPRARGAEVLRFALTREHAATFRAKPGTRALRPAPATAVDGFALAGAWTATEWPATLEGAVRSGHAAATVVLAQLDR